MTSIRCESFDFLGYTFGPMHSPRTGGRYNGARPSKKAVASIRDKIRRRLRPGNHAPWAEVAGDLNRMARGWAGYFSYGSVTKARHAVNCICITRSVAFFAVGIRWLAADTGSFPLKMCLGSWASCLPNPVPGSSARLSACLDVKSVREPGAGNLHARFDERGGETERWTSRRAQQRKTPRALGAAGPVHHRASPRLYRTGALSQG